MIKRDETITVSTDPDWEAAAEAAVEELIEAGKNFTAKDVQEKLDKMDVTTPTKRSLGSVIRRYSRKKRIVRTGRYRTTGSNGGTQIEWGVT